ncbi:MAG: hypothetical protein FJY21_00860 [Bacteroidetes bacterium]|nr:hypothetical protein [Bacteroidota bacterium]
MNYSLKELVQKVQDVNTMSFEAVADSIGYTRELLLKKIGDDDNNETIDLLFMKHPNSLRGMRDTK